jgi:hypothetical protein
VSVPGWAVQVPSSRAAGVGPGASSASQVPGLDDDPVGSGTVDGDAGGAGVDGTGLSAPVDAEGGTDGTEGVRLGSADVAGPAQAARKSTSVAWNEGRRRAMAGDARPAS